MSKLGAIIRNVEVGLFIPHGGYWLVKGNTPTALFYSLPLLPFRFSFPWRSQEMSSW